MGAHTPASGKFQKDGTYARNNFFLDDQASTDAFVEFDFVNGSGEQFLSGGVTVICDSSNGVVFSFDGTTIDGRVAGVGESVTFDHLYAKSIWIKSATNGASGNVRVYAW